MNPYAYISKYSEAIHDALIGWVRTLMQEANLETVEVYGQFPPDGTVAAHLTLFPYFVGPVPKLVETGKMTSLLHVTQIGDGKVDFVPDAWRELGGLMMQILERWYPNQRPKTSSQQRGYVHPTLDTLPKPVAEWYRQQEPEGVEQIPWLVERDGKLFAPPPSLSWSPGLVMEIRYVAVASDPGRGTSQYTSEKAPLTVPALSVLATGIHMEKEFRMVQETQLIPPALDSFIEAVAASLDGEEVDQVRALLKTLREPEEITVPVSPVHDLNNQEFALLMQALQRPLQAALHLQVEVVLGAHPVFLPAAYTRTVARPTRESLLARRGGEKG